MNDIDTTVEKIRFADSVQLGRMFVEGEIDETEYDAGMYLFVAHGKGWDIPALRGFADEVPTGRGREIVEAYLAVTPHPYAGAY